MSKDLQIRYSQEAGAEEGTGRLITPGDPMGTAKLHEAGRNRDRTHSIKIFDKF